MVFQEMELKDVMASRVIQVQEETQESREERVALDPREMTETQVTLGWIMTSPEILVLRGPRATGDQRAGRDHLAHLALPVLMNVRYSTLS